MTATATNPTKAVDLPRRLTIGKRTVAILETPTRDGKHGCLRITDSRGKSQVYEVECVDDDKLQWELSYWDNTAGEMICYQLSMVRGGSCSCKGYQYQRKCKHLDCLMKLHYRGMI